MLKKFLRSIGMATRAAARGGAPVGVYSSVIDRAAQVRQVQGVDAQIDAMAGLSPLRRTLWHVARARSGDWEGTGGA